MEVQERIKPRHLTAEQAAHFVQELKKIPDAAIEWGFTSAAGDEAHNLAKQLLPLFKQAGWLVRNEASLSNHLDIQVIGVAVIVPQVPKDNLIELSFAQLALQSAFRDIGIELQFIHLPNKEFSEIVIGSKPNP